MTKTLGVMGGGQLARMWAQAAQHMGYSTVVLDPDANSPAAQIANQHIAATYDDPVGWAQLEQACEAVTTEFENVSAEALRYLARHLPVAPSADAVAISQDRRAEKAFFKRCAAEWRDTHSNQAIDPAPYAFIETRADCEHVPNDLFPAILKTARMGYDGKGQVSVRTAAELLTAWNAVGAVPCVVEKRLHLLAECSVIVARGFDGQTVHWPLQRNTHVNGILMKTQVRDWINLSQEEQGALSPELTQDAIAFTKHLAVQLNYVGVLCVEFFIVRRENGAATLVVNEMAPRPHNSGHYSLDACNLSQFEAQVRCMAGLPLVQPRLHSEAIMLNLLGDLWFANSDEATEPNWPAVLALPSVHLHLYGKTDVRRGRKMGHLTLVGQDWGNLVDSAMTAMQALHLSSLEL